jgi:hypothetical protein
MRSSRLPRTVSVTRQTVNDIDFIRALEVHKAQEAEAALARARAAKAEERDLPHRSKRRPTYCRLGVSEFYEAGEAV